MKNNSEIKLEEIKAAYAYCQKIAHNHYENFPVASFILAKRLRAPIAVIYAFARTADDIVDEGNESAEERLIQLEQFNFYLDMIKSGKTIYFDNDRLHPDLSPIFLALQHVIISYQLPIELFYDLLTAFKQDLMQTDYQTFEEILHYCHYSANPVGRLLLHLNGQATPENLLLSDHICTGLQLINFMQDLASDLKDRHRCYIPIEDLEKFHITKEQLIRISNPPLHMQTHMHSDLYRYEAHQLINFQLVRIQQLYSSGRPLGRYLKGLFGLEIRLIIEGGQQILNKLKPRTYFCKPKLENLDWLQVFWRAVFF